MLWKRSLTLAAYCIDLRRARQKSTVGLALQWSDEIVEQDCLAITVSEQADEGPRLRVVGHAGGQVMPVVRSAVAARAPGSYT